MPIRFQSLETKEAEVELQDVLDKLNLSLRGLARALGGSVAMAVYWKKIGHIPDYRQAQIRELAKLKGIDL